MADKSGKGLVARWLEGKERSEDYARSTLPTNRWSLFWDIIKGRFGRLMLINLLVLITFLPVMAVYVWRYLALTVQDMTGPFGSGLMIGYPVIPNVEGVAELQTFQSDIVFFALYILAGIVASLGISGGMYIIRNLIWTEGIFVANDFVRGIKRNFWNVLEAVLIFTVLLFFTQSTQNLCDLYLATGTAGKGWMIASKVAGYVVIILAYLICLWMISLGVNYKQGPWALFRNAVIMSIGMLPQTIFFAVIASIPFLLILYGSGFFLALGVIVLLLFGFSFTMLVWMDFSQWAFDRFINPNIGASVGKGLYNKNAAKGDKTGAVPAVSESEAMREYRRMIVAQGKSKLVCRPIKPIDDGMEVYQLPESFSREDLQRLRESKEKIDEDVKAYEEEHKNDEQYVEYNRQFEEQERALEEDGKKKKKPKHPPKMLNKR